MVADADPNWLATRASIVRAIRSGAISAKSVIEELGVSASIVGGWCRAEDVRRRPAPDAIRFAEVTLAGRRSAPALVVSLRGGRRLRVPPGFDAAEVSRLVRALESC